MIWSGRSRAAYRLGRCSPDGRPSPTARAIAMEPWRDVRGPRSRENLAGDILMKNRPDDEALTNGGRWTNEVQPVLENLGGNLMFKSLLPRIRRTYRPPTLRCRRLGEGLPPPNCRSCPHKRRGRRTRRRPFLLYRDHVIDHMVRGVNRKLVLRGLQPAFLVPLIPLLLMALASKLAQSFRRDVIVIAAAHHETESR